MVKVNVAKVAEVIGVQIFQVKLIKVRVVEAEVVRVSRVSSLICKGRVVRPRLSGQSLSG